MSGDLFRKAILVVVLIGASATVYRAYENARPCVKPITFSIGSFDTHFGISKSDYVSDLERAADMWNKAAGKMLFAYAVSGGVPVNLMYDARQAHTDLGKQIDEKQAEYNADKARVDVEQQKYLDDKAQYEEQVSSWNKKGGAPPQVYNQLESTRTALERERVTLNADIAALNIEARSTNSDVAAYNANHGTFEEGEYIRDANGARINLYEFTNETQLIRLAAHELGHAVGLDHVQDPNAIMYPINKGSSLLLTDDDKSALSKLCASSPLSKIF